ncbi:hypothetical protein Y032_0013g2126 [Ancylostoma ceylanicum]|uniref:Uncharacterized protein n=1 Tax=Ancylostoma ceylanicum TaxID=53326 RepID=A0A016VDK2_9BILA|nr:hypothetical protein Y032_0013g2126 [Ancylostoma ceylanicum]
MTSSSQRQPSAKRMLVYFDDACRKIGLQLNLKEAMSIEEWRKCFEEIVSSKLLCICVLFILALRGSIIRISA